jgi:hypothetical protein
VGQGEERLVGTLNYSFDGFDDAFDVFEGGSIGSCEQYD